MKEDMVWVEENLCWVENIFDPGRRIYFWFCLTHLFKALRNQLLASQPSGTKAFLDANGFPIGWNLILKLNHKLKQLKDKEPRAYKNVRLNDKVANPTSYRKMDISLLKKMCEHKTMRFGEEILCLALGLNPADLKTEVFYRLLSNPPIQLGSNNGQNYNRRHGYHLEMAKLIVEKMRELENEF